MNQYPVTSDSCSDCGAAVDLNQGEDRCPTCFNQYLFNIDAGFLESFRKFGGRSRLVVAETCLRALVLDTPEHRKILSMTIFEQYVQSMSDLAGLFAAFLNREKAPIFKSFMEYRLDAAGATSFFEVIRTLNDVELCTILGLPLPGEIKASCPYLDEKDQYQLAIAVYHLTQDLRKATEQGETAALALAQINGGISNAIIANDARWLDQAATRLPPDQVAMLILDSKRRALYVQGISAEEHDMARVVDAVDTVTRATSNLIYAYLQSHNL